MEITGTQSIAAPRQRVWEALNDPDILKRCLPGCESVLRSSAEEFKVVMAAAIGPLRARFNGVLRMSDIQAPASCTMVFEGQGGAVGFGKGNSSVTLAEIDGRTELSYTAHAQVGGKLAQVGSRLIDSVARKMADDFFRAFEAQLTAPDDRATQGSVDHASPALDAIPGAHAAHTPQQARARVDEAAVAPDPAALPGAAMPMQPLQAVTGAVLVPGWWLGVAAALGSGATVLGVLLGR